MGLRSCDDAPLKRGDSAVPKPTRRRRTVLLLAVTGTLVMFVATLFVALLALHFGPFSTRLAVALAAIAVVSPIALLYLAICLVGLAKGRRPSFQLHLSTCIALMFVASVLVWANVAHNCDGWPVAEYELETQTYAKNRPWRDLSLDELPERLLLWSVNVSACVAILAGTAIILESVTVRRKAGEPHT